MFLDKQKQVRDDNDRKLHKIKINSPSLISQLWRRRPSSWSLGGKREIVTPEFWFLLFVVAGRKWSDYNSGCF